MNQLYVDTCCLIYLIESSGPVQSAVARRLADHGSLPGSVLVTSRLARLECRTRPLRDADTGLLSRYETFFSAPRFRLIDISAAVIECATELRARHGFKTPDALHLATAILERADVFLTADQALAKCTEVAVEIIG